MLTGKVGFIFLITLFFIFQIVSNPPNVALACDFHALSVFEYLEDHTYAVLAEVIEVDSASRNGLLKIETYLSGTAGPQYIRFSQFLPSTAYGKVEGVLETSCSTSGAYLEPGNKIITFLNRNADGSYSPLITGAQIYDPIFVFKDDNPQEIRYFFDREGEFVQRWDDNQELIISPAEFAEWVAHASASEFLEPIQEQSLPLEAPILLQTDTGRAYMLPMDYAEPVLLGEQVKLIESAGAFIAMLAGEQTQLLHRQRMDLIVDQTPDAEGWCLERLCLGFSEDGLDLGYWHLEGSINLGEANFQKGWYLASLMNIPPSDPSMYGYPIFNLDPHDQNVDAFLFTPKNFGVAIWHPDNLTVETCFSGLPEWLCKPKVYETSLTFSSENPIREQAAGYGAWSPDQRLLAFSDERGLWIWDVFPNGGQTNLLMEANPDGTVPVALHFSNTGRYLAIENQNERFYLDLVNSEQLPYGSLNEVDTRLITLDWKNQNRIQEACILVPNYRCDTVEIVVNNPVWVNEHKLLGLNCIEDGCFLFSRETEEARWWDSSYSPDFLRGTFFDYDAESQQVLLLKNGNILSIIDAKDDFPYSLNLNTVFTFALADQIEDKIITAEWLPSVYYHD